MSDEVAHDASGQVVKVSIFKVFANPKARRALILAAILIIGAQVGSWGVGAWLPTYLTSERGLSVEAMANVTMASYVAAFVGYWVAGVLSDKIGRRKTYIFLTVWTTLALLAYMNLSNNDTVIWFAALFGFAMYPLFAPLGALVSESVPPEARGAGLSFIWGLGRVAAAVVPTLVGGFATVIGLWGCIMFCVVFFVLMIIASLLLKETKGNAVTAQEIVDRLDGK